MVRVQLAMMTIITGGSVFLGAQTPDREKKLPARKWPAQVARVEIPCSDGVLQPAMWSAPAPVEKKPVPLLVGLHTWSSNHATAGGDAVYADWCIAHGWAFIHPEFRGPNWTPQALGSDRAMQDVVEAVDWARRHTPIDESRIYLVGVSGGGHMAMMMAGRHPGIWAGVSAWCGIADVAQWHAEHLKSGRPDGYARNIEAALGHAPARNDEAAWRRSPLSCLHAASSVPLDINHGIHDGRSGSVPFVHSLRAFNAVVQTRERLDESAFPIFYETLKLPAGWNPAASDATYGVNAPLFRRVSGSTRVTIFEGGHEIVHQAALNWLAKQQKGRPVVWQVDDFVRLDHQDGASGK